MNTYIKRFLTVFILAFIMLFTVSPALATYADDNATHSTEQTEKNIDLDAENGAESGDLPETEETPEQDEPTEESPDDGAEVLPEEPDVPEEPTQGTDEETPEEDNAFNIEELATKFNQYLKDKYGAEYENIYNGIIEQWGSVEAYLLQFGQEHLGEEQQEGWFAFVGWLGEYSVIWAPVLAVVFIIVVAIFGKKTFNKIVDTVTKSKVDPLITELNKQSKALAALAEATESILPKNEKYAEKVLKLEESKKELTE